MVINTVSMGDSNIYVEVQTHSEHLNLCQMVLSEPL